MAPQCRSPSRSAPASRKAPSLRLRSRQKKSDRIRLRYTENWRRSALRDLSPHSRLRAPMPLRIQVLRMRPSIGDGEFRYSTTSDRASEAGLIGNKIGLPVSFTLFVHSLRRNISGAFELNVAVIAGRQGPDLVDNE